MYFFPQKVPKTPRRMPSPATNRLTLAPGDYSRVCKQTVPSARAFSPHLFERLFCQAGFIRRHSGGKDASGTSKKHRSLRSPLEAVLNRRIIVRSGKKEHSPARVPGAGGCKGLILLRPLNAGRRRLPRRTTCGWFWCYLLPSKGSYAPRAKTAVNSRPKSGKQHQSKTAISTFCDPTASGNLRDRGGARASVSAKSVAIFRSRTRFATFGLVVPGKIVTFESYLFKPIERCSNACSRLRPSSIKRG